MTSVSMYIAPKVKINGEVATPKNFNIWLSKNGGYSGCGYVWTPLDKWYGIKFLGFTTSI